MTVVPPAEHRDPVVVAFGFPGGGYNRAYFDLGPDLDGVLAGPGGTSEARWHAERGWCFVACDHLGVGDSSQPDPGSLSLEVLAAANDATVRSVCAQLEAGTLHADLPAVRVAARLGLGQSMGGCLTIVAQGRHRTFDGIGVLGYSARHTVLPTPSGEGTEHPNVERGSTEVSLAASAAAVAHAFRYAFHWDDVASQVVDADLDQYPFRDDASPAWGRGATPPPAAVSMMSPGVVAPEAAEVDVPVLVAVGARDVVPDLHREPSAYPSATDICLFAAPAMAHMHNFAGTREQFWRRIHAWGDRVSDDACACTKGSAG